jgi:hypothetical protein
VQAELLLFKGKRKQTPGRLFRRAPGREYRVKILVQSGYELFVA